jgi:hypothetical protein
MKVVIFFSYINFLAEMVSNQESESEVRQKPVEEEKRVIVHSPRGNHFTFCFWKSNFFVRKSRPLQNSFVVMEKVKKMTFAIPNRLLLSKKVCCDPAMEISFFL